MNAASGEIFPHPLTDAVVFDISVKLTNGGFNLAPALEAGSYLMENGPADLPSGEHAALTSFFLTKLSKGARPSSTLKRYSLEWAYCEVCLRNPHGIVRTRRRRSIKKRLAKRLTSLAQRRFWVV